MKPETPNSVWMAITDWAKERRIVRTTSSAGGDITMTLTHEDKAALMHVIWEIMRREEGTTARTFRWKAKELGRQLGKAGAKIYELRCQLETSRSVYDKIAGGDYWRLLDQRNDLQRRVKEMEELIKEKENA